LRKKPDEKNIKQKEAKLPSHDKERNRQKRDDGKKGRENGGGMR